MDMNMNMYANITDSFYSIDACHCCDIPRCNLCVLGEQGCCTRCCPSSNPIVARGQRFFDRAEGLLNEVLSLQREILQLQKSAASCQPNKLVVIDLNKPKHEEETLIKLLAQPPVQISTVLDSRRNQVDVVPETLELIIRSPFLSDESDADQSERTGVLV